MTQLNNNTVNQHGYSLQREYHDFMENTVVPATQLSSEAFWELYVSVLDCTGHDNQNLCASAGIKNSDIEVSVGEASLSLNAIKSSWGSLYKDLYQEEVIPHAPGLKPGVNEGDKVNVARRERVISCSKNFLDKTFPLSEGSHRDAVSYMVYFQNLLVILADGSTTGLKEPKQFIGKNGPTNEPESILLKHSDMHAEIMFDRHGKTGEHDLAHIDDIHLEGATQTLLNFAAASLSDKCDTYRNWAGLVKNGLQNRTYSGKDGEILALEQKHLAIKLSTQSDNYELVRNREGQIVPEAVIDAITAALIYSNTRKSTGGHLQVYIPDTTSNINDQLILMLGKLLTQSRLNSRNSNRRGERKQETDNTPDTILKVLAASADTLAPNEAPMDCEQYNPECVAISAMQSHGYDLTQATLS